MKNVPHDYFGCMIDSEGSCKGKIKKKCPLDKLTIVKLIKIWKSHDIRKTTNIKMIQTSVILYETETWTQIRKTIND